MKNKILIEEFKEIDYALVKLTNNEVTPWVAAWAYNKENNCWGQGHYFRTFEDASRYILDLLEEKRNKNKAKPVVSPERFKELAETALSYLWDEGLHYDFFEDRDIDLSEEEWDYFMKGVENDENFA